MKELNNYKDNTFLWIDESDDGSKTCRTYTFYDIVKEVKKTSKEFGYTRDRVFIHWPDDENKNLQQFLDQFHTRLRVHFANCVVTKHENAILQACISGPQTMANGREADVIIHQVGENATFCCAFNGNHMFFISFRLIGCSVEISRMLVEGAERNKGVGTFLVESARSIAANIGVRLMLYPCPPQAEVRDQQMNKAQIALACQRLERFYARRQFVKCLKEYIPVIQISGLKLTNIGLRGFMSSLSDANTTSDSHHTL